MPLYTKIHFYYREGRGNAHLTGNYKRIGDVVLHNFDSVTTEYYMRYVDTHGLILEKLERVLSDPNASQGHFRFAQVFRDFESQKVCYLPITTLILKPLHRILHYEILLERKCILFLKIGQEIFHFFLLDRSTQTLQSKPSRLPEHQYGHGENSECDS